VIKIVLFTGLVVPQFLAMAKRNEAKSSRRDVGVDLSTHNLKKNAKPFVLFKQRKNIQIGCRLASNLKDL
jgi:hypothetical protein